MGRTGRRGVGGAEGGVEEDEEDRVVGGEVAAIAGVGTTTSGMIGGGRVGHEVGRSRGAKEVGHGRR